MYLSAIVHEILGRELNELRPDGSDLLTSVRRFGFRGFLNRVTHLQECLLDSFGFLDMELVSFYHGRYVIYISLSFLQDFLSLRSLQNLINKVHFLILVSALGIATEWNVASHWRGRLPASVVWFLVLFLLVNFKGWIINDIMHG